MSYAIDTSHPSPNHGPRVGADISMICLHATVGGIKSSLAWLTNPASRVSTHYLIDKTGYIYQLVPDDRAAWHAGASEWFDLDSGDIQRQSLGIELENKNNGVDPYPPAQMTALLELSRHLVTTYQIVPDMVVRHLDIAIPKGRKTDPASFPWAQFKSALYTHTVTAGPHGAIAQEDRRPGALAARYYPPGTPIVCDDLTSSYWHVAAGDGFIPVGQVQA